MGLFLGDTDFFGLDIGSSAVRVVQLSGGRQKVLSNYKVKEVDPKVAMSDAPADRQALARAIRETVVESGIGTTNVAVGIPSSRIFSAVVDMDRLNPEEMAKTIAIQADSLIPTPLSESKMDWAVLGDSPKDPSKVEVLISSAPNVFIEQRLDMLESIGLNVVAFEPDSIALSRSLLSAEVLSPTLIVDMGDVTSDLVITLNGLPRLMRTIQVGNQTIVKAAIQNLSIDEKQAIQFIYKFGISKDKLEGQIYNAIIGSVDLLIGEIEKSIKFFMTRYNNIKVDRIIVTGGASTLPELPLYVANKFGVTVEIGNAWRNVAYPVDRQNELMTVSHQFSVAAGLAERTE